MARPDKEDMIETVVGGHIDDIETWIREDRESLRKWLRLTLKLDHMSSEKIHSEFSAYFDGSEEEEDGTVCLLKDIVDEADHIIGSEAKNHKEVAIKNAKNIKRWAQQAIKELEGL